MAGVQDKAYGGTAPCGSFVRNADMANGLNDFYLRFDELDFKEERDRIRALVSTGDSTADFEVMCKPTL